MERSRRMVVLAHCLLNVNSRVPGIASYDGVHPLAIELAQRGYGLIQLPCPELGPEGLDRSPKTKAEYDTPSYREHCSRIAEEIAREVGSYVEAGFEVAAVVGVDGSPSCGVETTSAEAPLTESGTRRVSGRGVLIDEIAEALAPWGVDLASVDSHDADLGVARAMRVIEG